MKVRELAAALAALPEEHQDRFVVYWDYWRFIDVGHAILNISEFGHGMDSVALIGPGEYANSPLLF